MEKPIFGKALLPVLIFGLMIIILYFFIGGDKAPVVFQIFSLPWSILFDVDPYAKNVTTLGLFIADNYGAVLVVGSIFNAAIIYGLSLFFLKIKRDKHLHATV